jgi:hypothetical protein
MFNRKIMVGAEGANIIKQGHGTIAMSHRRQYQHRTDVTDGRSGGGAFVDAPSV